MCKAENALQRDVSEKSRGLSRLQVVREKRSLVVPLGKIGFQTLE